MSPAATKKKEKLVGRVTHYYDHIGVAVLDLAASLKVGDTVCFRHGDHDLIQEVTSLQVDHAPLISARKGQAVGMKVGEPVHEGTPVIKV